MHYQVGGSLTTDAPSYIARKADEAFAAALKRGEFCYVLNSRQMGKSSLMVRSHQQCQRQGYQCAVLDMTNIGSENITPLQWYKGIVKDLWRSFKLTRKANFKFKDWWQDEEDISLLQRLSRFIKDVLLTQFPDSELIIFVDEIDSILGLPFSIDDFFALIRFCYNQRAIDPDYKRIHFAIFGVATPADLIQNRSRTPFNIGTPIYLDGFTQSEAKPLARGLSLKVGDPQAVLKAILNWTNGQPFLTQKICQLAISSSQDAISQPLAIPPGNEAYWVDELVRSRILNRWESQDEPEHLRTIRNRILNNSDTAGRLLSIYQQALEGDVLIDDSREQIELLLSGLVHKSAGKLRVKNKIYSEIFNSHWIKQQLDHLRPYAQQLDAWAASEQTDSSRLLRGQALKDAQAWVQGKQLSDLDYRYLAASVESDRKATQQALEAQRLAAVEAQLKEEQARLSQEKKTRKFQQLLSGVISAALLVTLGLGAFALRQAQKAQISEVKALVSAAEGSFDSHRQLEAVVQALQAHQKIDNLRGAHPEIKQSVKETLQSVMLGIDEANRLNFDAEVQDAVFSPDGQHIAVVTASGLLSLRQNNGAVIWEIPAHSAAINAVAFSPDGQLIATASADQTIKLWTPDGEAVSSATHSEIKHTESILKLQFLPDGQSIVAGGRNSLGRWRIDGQQLMSRPDSSLRAISADSSFMVFLRPPNPLDSSRTQMPAPRALNANLRQQNPSAIAKAKRAGPIQRVRGQKAELPRHPDREGNTLIADIAGNITHAFHSEDGPIFSVAISADNQLIATSGVDGAVHIWDKEGTFKQALIGNKSDVRRIAFSPNGKLIATAGDDKVIRLWQLNGGLIKTLEGHQAEINRLVFSADSQQLMSVSDDQTLRLWQVTKPQHQILAGHGDAIRNLTFNADGQLFSSSVDRWLNVWQQQRDRFAPIPVAQITPGTPHVVGVATFGKETAIAANQGLIKIWRPAQWNAANWTTEEYEPKQVLQRDTILEKLAYSPDGQHLIALTEQGYIQHWIRNADNQFSENPTQIIDSVEQPNAIAFSPDSKFIAIGSKDHTLTLIATNGKRQQTFSAHKDSIFDIAFSPDGQWIISASADREIRLWPVKDLVENSFNNDFNNDFDNGFDIDFNSDFNIERVETIATESVPVARIAFSADSQAVISALQDGSIKIRSVSTGKTLRTLRGHQSALSALAVSPNGQFIASAGRDRKIILWNLPDILAQDEVASACAWISDYLAHNPAVSEHRNLCAPPSRR